MKISITIFNHSFRILIEKNILVAVHFTCMFFILLVKSSSLKKHLRKICFIYFVYIHKEKRKLQQRYK